MKGRREYREERGGKMGRKTQGYVTHLEKEATDSTEHMETCPVPSWEGRGLMSINTNQQSQVSFLG